VEIREDDVQGAAILSLLREHVESAAEHSPPESVHALDSGGLRAPNITFWTGWEEDELLGCVALKELEQDHGEIKSMRTVTRHQRKGVASQLLEHMIKEAERRSYSRLSLETGSMDAFQAARTLYSRYGFEYCGPFADYVLDPYSVFMTRRLSDR
jgi:putative acetyltransferase